MRLPSPDQLLELLDDQHIAATSDAIAAAYAAVFAQ